MKILVKFPTRGRKSKFLNTLMKYYKMCDDLGNMDFLVSIDEDDIEMNNQHTFDILNTYQNLNYVIGKSESKIHAVNRDIDTSGDWDIILLASDDMIPIKDGYDKIIIEKMKENYPDTDGVLSQPAMAPSFSMATKPRSLARTSVQLSSAKAKAVLNLRGR